MSKPLGLSNSLSKLVGSTAKRLTLALVLTGATSSIANAQPTPNAQPAVPARSREVDSAERHYLAGLTAFHARRYAEALVELQTAYSLHPLTQIADNIRVCQYLMLGLSGAPVHPLLNSETPQLEQRRAVALASLQRDAAYLAELTRYNQQVIAIRIQDEQWLSNLTGISREQAISLQGNLATLLRSYSDLVHDQEQRLRGLTIELPAGNEPDASLDLCEGLPSAHNAATGHPLRVTCRDNLLNLQTSRYRLALLQRAQTAVLARLVVLNREASSSLQVAHVVTPDPRVGPTPVPVATIPNVLHWAALGTGAAAVVSSAILTGFYVKNSTHLNNAYDVCVRNYDAAACAAVEDRGNTVELNNAQVPISAAAFVTAAVGIAGGIIFAMTPSTRPASATTIPTTTPARPRASIFVTPTPGSGTGVAANMSIVF